MHAAVASCFIFFTTRLNFTQGGYNGGNYLMNEGREEEFTQENII